MYRMSIVRKALSGTPFTFISSIADMKAPAADSAMTAAAAAFAPDDRFSDIAAQAMIRPNISGNSHDGTRCAYLS